MSNQKACAALYKIQMSPTCYLPEQELIRVTTTLTELPPVVQDNVVRAVINNRNKGPFETAAAVCDIVTKHAGESFDLIKNEHNPLVRAMTPLIYGDNQLVWMWVKQLALPQTISQMVDCLKTEQSNDARHLSVLSHHLGGQQSDLQGKKLYLRQLTHRLRWLSQDRRDRLVDFVETHRTWGPNVLTHRLLWDLTDCALGAFDYLNGAPDVQTTFHPSPDHPLRFGEKAPYHNITETPGELVRFHRATAVAAHVLHSMNDAEFMDWKIRVTTPDNIVKRLGMEIYKNVFNAYQYATTVIPHKARMATDEAYRKAWNEKHYKQR